MATKLSAVNKKIPLFKVSMHPSAQAAAVEVLTPDQDENLYVGQGPKVEKFEDKFQELIGTPERPLSTNSCTSALILALKTLKIGPGDFVISTAQTCTASNAAIVQTGATILWADVNSHTGLLDPLSVAYLLGQCKASKKPVQAILAVDWGGAHCDYRALNELAEMHNIYTIQDAAHCIFINPENHGHFVAWSFGPIKHLCMVDGGALLVPPRYYQEAKLRRWYGIDRESGDSFRCQNEIRLDGAKFHANDLQASIGLANMQYAVACQKKARANAEFYTRELQPLAQQGHIVLPPNTPDHNWWLYSLLAPGNRDRLINYLGERLVTASPVHARNDLHPVYRRTSEQLVPLSGLQFFSDHQLSIPVGWWVSAEEREHVVGTIKDFFKSG